MARERQEPTKVWIVLAGLMLATFLSALDGSIVSTAMPTITGRLSGFDLYSWVFSLYLLTTTVTVPIYGKLADLYGRKRVLLFGIALFLLGSALCGSAQSMLQLVLYRGLQGLGGGAILPISTTILGDLFPLQQRAKVQGWMSSVWGISAVAGPAAGGLIVDHTSWRWIFYLNLPTGALAVFTLVAFFHERPATHRHTIDYAGALALLIGTSCLLLGLTSGGQTWPWSSAESLGVFAVAAVALIIFLAVEMRAPEPVLPLALFRNRLIAVANGAALLTGGVFVGISIYIPLFVQGVLGTTATEAGAVVAAMSITWAAASSRAGHMIIRWGYRATALTGSGFLIASVALLLLVGRTTPAAYLALCALVGGVGAGLTTTSFIVGIQNEVTWERRGSATASNLFLRSLGSTIWVALLGSVVTNTLVADTRGSGASNPLDVVDALLDPVRAHQIAPATLEAVHGALAHAFHAVFLWEAITAVAVLIVIVAMPAKGAAEQSVPSAVTSAAPTSEAQASAPPEVVAGRG